MDYARAAVSCCRQKAKQLAHDPALQGMRHVKLPKGSVRTAFWRYHTDGVVDEAVSTIEAVHSFLRLLLAAGGLQVRCWACQWSHAAVVLF